MQVLQFGSGYEPSGGPSKGNLVRDVDIVLLCWKDYTFEETSDCGWIVALSAIMVVSVKALKLHAECWTT